MVIILGYCHGKQAVGQKLAFLELLKNALGIYTHKIGVERQGMAKGSIMI